MKSVSVTLAALTNLYAFTDWKTIAFNTMEKHYRIELAAYGKKEAVGRWGGFDEANAFFSTDAKPATAEFIKATEKAMDKTFEQQSRYWLDYTIGKLFVQDGWEKVSPMSPEWEYRTPSTMSHAVWKEVK